MTAIDTSLSPEQAPAEKGLKGGAIGLVSSVVIGVASTAPAYSLAATIGLIAVAVGCWRRWSSSWRSFPCCSSRSATAS